MIKGLLSGSLLLLFFDSVKFYNGSYISLKVTRRTFPFCDWVVKVSVNPDLEKKDSSNAFDSVP